MNIKYVRSLPVSSCKSFYKLRTKGPTGQEKYLLNFIKDKNIDDIAYITDDQLAPADPHSMVIFIQRDPVDIDIFIDRAKSLSLLATNYFYIAVNKFCLSSSVDRNIDIDNCDYDQKIINFIEKSINQRAIYTYWDSNDSGFLGNFEFPITQLLFKNE